MVQTTQHCLGLFSLSKDDILSLIDVAQSFKPVVQQKHASLTTLTGKTIVTLFAEPSTRTRMSFELAIRLLGANPMVVDLNVSSLKKGETILDTIRNLEAMGADAFVVRHRNGGAPQFIARYSKVPVINAGDGFTEHPTQGLLDMMTMMDHRGDLAGKHVLILGDIKHSRVARSNLYGLLKLGAKITLCGPPTFIPDGIEALGVTVSHYLDQVLPDVDIVNVLRVQSERQNEALYPSNREYRRYFGLTTARIKKAKKDLLILHPGPINRGVEIDSDVADGPQNVILDQVTNGVAMRMAVLNKLCNIKEGGLA